MPPQRSLPLGLRGALFFSLLKQAFSPNDENDHPSKAAAGRFHHHPQRDPAEQDVASRQGTPVHDPL